MVLDEKDDIAEVREFHLESQIFKTAVIKVDAAVDAYRANIAEFGLDNDWPPNIPAETLSDEDFSTYAFM